MECEHCDKETEALKGMLSPFNSTLLFVCGDCEKHYVPLQELSDDELEKGRGRHGGGYGV